MKSFSLKKKLEVQKPIYYMHTGGGEQIKGM
jgi:hypothetical protein